MLAFRFFLVVCVMVPLVHAQTTPAAAPVEAAETASREVPVTFQSKVNLVSVPVVVRDKKSNAVGNLTKDDFQIFDNGKLQVISRFSLDKERAASAEKPIAVEAADGTQATAATGTAPDIANRFVAYVFDDLHFNNEDLMTSRAAALKHMETLDTVTSRVAVFNTSGIAPEDFTSDRQKLEAALNRLMARSRGANPQTDCPFINYHTADLIVNHSDSTALQAAVSAAGSCPMRPPTSQTGLTQLVQASAYRQLTVGDSETHITITVLENLIKRISAMPGQRTLVLVSPGFLFPTQQQDISQLIDLAIRLNVVINAIDGRGLYVDSRYDASRSLSNNSLGQYEFDEATLGSETLSALAEGTGGTVFANNNDLLEGFRRTGSQPEFTYMLGFSPQDLKNDGKFHSIKVKLKESAGLTVQARRGYFGPKHSVEAGDKAKQDIEDALFTRMEMTDFPLSMNTQFFKSSETSAKLSIVVRVGLKNFHFRKAEGRNKDEVTIVAGLFDRDGNFMSAKQSIIDMRFRDETLQKRVSGGLAVRTTFDDVKPGVYVVRLVARDSEGQMISAANGAIEVP